MKCVTGPLLMICLALTFAGTSKAAQEPASSPAPGTVLRLHLGGLRQLRADTNGRTFKEIWSLPASQQLRDETLAKLAVRLAAQLQGKGGRQADAAPLLRPLLGDLLEAEWVLEAAESKEGALESALAVRLDASRLRVWETNWSQLLAGWELRSGRRLETVSTWATNSWFALRSLTRWSADSSQTVPTNALVTRLLEGQRPVPAAESWLSVDADLGRLMQWLGRPPRGELPRLRLSVAGRREYLRSEGQLTFAKPLPIALEKWTIPVETIRDPLISFTALQGFREWSKRQPLLRELKLEEAPNQLFLWGLSQTAFQIQAAVPLSDAGRVFNHIAEKWLPQFNATLAEHAVGHVIRLTDRPELVWRDLPLLVPYLNTVREGGQQFLHTGIFPVDPPTNAPPPQLFEQLTSRPGLLFYDWEITEARLAQLRPLLQLGAIFLTVSPMSTNSTAFKWLDAVEPRLGNTVTEVVLNSPRELSFVRTSHLGLNGFELLSVAKWLEKTNFPHLDLGLSFRPVIRTPSTNAP